MYCDMMGWNPFDAVKTAISSAFAVGSSAAKSAVPILTSSLPGALPLTIPAVVNTTLSTVPVVVKKALEVPIAVSSPLITTAVQKATQVTVPQIEAPQAETLVVPGYTKTESGEIVKEVNLKDWLSLIPLSALGYLAFAL